VHVEGPPPLLAIEWQGAAAPEPVAIDRDFPVAAGFGHWAWQDAAAIPVLEGAALAGAVEYLIRLHGMLASGDFTGFMEESRIKIDEYARAYGIAAGPVRESMLEALTSQAAELRLRPLKPAELDLRLVAGGRMIECLRADRTHALEFSGEEGQAFFLPAMIGISDGVWRLMR
jgi:hypothetical protein